MNKQFIFGLIFTYFWLLNHFGSSQSEKLIRLRSDWSTKTWLFITYDHLRFRKLRKTKLYNWFHKILLLFWCKLYTFDFQFDVALYQSVKIIFFKSLQKNTVTKTTLLGIIRKFTMNLTDKYVAREFQCKITMKSTLIRKSTVYFTCK